VQPANESDNKPTADQRLEYSKKVMPNSHAHKQKIKKLLDAMSEKPGMPDTSYYIVHQMPRPTQSQKYPPKGGKVAKSKLGEVPDMWLCFGAYCKNGCDEKLNCVYREGWLGIEEEVSLLHHCPAFLEEIRKTWARNQSNSKISHQTAVWPFAHAPCHYEDAFPAPKAPKSDDLTPRGQPIRGSAPKPSSAPAQSPSTSTTAAAATNEPNQAQTLLAQLQARRGAAN
jgi:hypothetical protein